MLHPAIDTHTLLSKRKLIMPQNKTPHASLSVVAEFPQQYFLENLAVREDNSVLIPAANKKELWYVPPADGQTRVTPVLLHSYRENAGGIVELEPDMFLLRGPDTRRHPIHQTDGRCGVRNPMKDAAPAGSVAAVRCIRLLLVEERQR